MGSIGKVGRFGIWFASEAIFARKENKQSSRSPGKSAQASENSNGEPPAYDFLNQPLGVVEVANSMKPGN